MGCGISVSYLNGPISKSVMKVILMLLVSQYQSGSFLIRHSIILFNLGLLLALPNFILSRIVVFVWPVAIILCVLMNGLLKVPLLSL